MQKSFPEPGKRKPEAPVKDGASLLDQVMGHPLFNNEGMLPTLPINEIYVTIRQAVILGETGCVFTGHSGIGKTSAINLVRSMLQVQFPKLCMFTHDSHNHHVPSVRAFFKHFLATVGHKEQRGETYDLRSRLVNILVDEARISGISKVVLFIDEASAMLKSDFLFLKDVNNDLARANIQLLTVLMGQSPDMEGVIATLRTDNRSDLVNRFASRVVPMRCYDSLHDLKMILQGIDSSKFPEEVGPTWTGFFLPLACAAGFKLEDEAPQFLQAIRESAIGITGKIRFPARQAFLAIRSFLLTAAGHDSDELRLPETSWRNAVAYAKLQDAILQIAAKPKPKAKSTRKENGV